MGSEMCIRDRRGINKDDWDNMDWADGIKPGQSVLVNGKTGVNRV